MRRVSPKRSRGRPKLTVNERRNIKHDGDRLRDALDKLGLSQKEVAERTGIRQGSISEIIHGGRALGREDLRRLGKAGIPPSYLLGLTDTVTPTPELLDHDLRSMARRHLKYLNDMREQLDDLRDRLEPYLPPGKQ